jgi:uncharacterized integral membrane protein
MATEPDDRTATGGWAEFKDGRAPKAGKTDHTGKKDWQKDIAPRLAVALVALAAAIIFVVQNSNRVETTFLFFDGRARLWIVILVSVVLGAALGQAVGLMHRRRGKRD